MERLNLPSIDFQKSYLAVSNASWQPGHDIRFCVTCFFGVYIVEL